MSAVPQDKAGAAAQDVDAQETREWLEALDAVIAGSAGTRIVP